MEKNMELEKAYTATEISELRYDAYIMGRNKEYEKSMKVINKQNKIIDLMAEKFSETVCFVPLNQKCNQGDKNFDKSKCIRCIRQYFEKKVEENK